MHSKKLLLKLREQVLKEVEGLKIPIKLSKKDLSSKKIPKKYQKEIIEALSNYPELKNTCIEFRLIQKGFFTMNAMINILRLFTKKRLYVIFLNDKRIKQLKFLSKNKGITSVIAHELGHIIDYEKKSICELLFFGMKYLLPFTRKNIELKNEIRNYYHGQSKSMIYHNNSLIKATVLTKRYLKYHERLYLQNDDINFLKTLKP